MNLTWPFLATILPALLLSITAPGRSGANGNQLAVTNLATPISLSLSPVQQTHLNPVLTNGPWGQLGPVLLKGNLQRRAEAAPKPGVYRTEPFACIVIVPGGHPDEQSVVKPGDSDSTMPMIEPELRFVPLK
jgi:hypothetical protein